MRADLHIHTTASDGRWTAKQLVEGVLAEGIALFAVTDHDSVGNIAPVMALLDGAGLAFLPGVEVSTLQAGNVFHILGYGIDPTHGPLLALLNEHETKLREVDDEDMRDLIALGFPIDWEDYVAYTYDRTRGGFKSLNYLIDLGLCDGPKDFFARIRELLHHRWPDFAPPGAASAMIRQAGGVPILAHPGASFMKLGGVTGDNLHSALAWGIAGVECYSQYHDPETTAFCVDWCTRHDLLITGGSDYHGGLVNRQLGKPFVDTDQLRLGELEDKIMAPLQRGGFTTENAEIAKET
ncbi:MAG: PHP domain-containing protein [Anaerolineae bacterium]|nr:PHP domain-containing protein [Anaerolineae bacterium]